MIDLRCGDSLEILPTLEIGTDYAVITDPPYGIDYDASHTKYKNGIDRGVLSWDKEPYDPSPILALNLPTILWGGELLCLSPSRSPWLALLG